MSRTHKDPHIHRVPYECVTENHCHLYLFLCLCLCLGLSNTSNSISILYSQAPKDEHQTPSQIGDGSRQIEPSAALGQTQEGVLSKALQHDLDMACQCLGLLYEANVDPTAISEAVA
jgi:hypothetical protein